MRNDKKSYENIPIIVVNSHILDVMNSYTVYATHWIMWTNIVWMYALQTFHMQLLHNIYFTWELSQHENKTSISHLIRSGEILLYIW